MSDRGGLVRVPPGADWMAWFPDEPPGRAALAAHVAGTGLGSVWADRWPDARMVLVRLDDNVQLRGDPAAAAPERLAPLVRGFVDAPAAFEPVLRACARVLVWPRVVHALESLERVHVPDAVRPVHPDDAGLFRALPADLGWICATWGGTQGLCTSGFAWAAFADESVTSVACSFYVGRRNEEVGVVTRADRRRLGLSTACAAGLCADILARGRTPTWTTSPDNAASLRVARKLGFRHVRDDVLYVVGVDVPR